MFVKGSVHARSNAVSACLNDTVVPRQRCAAVLKSRAMRKLLPHLERASQRCANCLAQRIRHETWCRQSSCSLLTEGLFCLSHRAKIRNEMSRAPSSAFDGRPSTIGGGSSSASAALRTTNAKKKEYETVAALEQSAVELQKTFSMFSHQLSLAEGGALCE